ncbi:MAG: XRE family transcriptional regulator [Oscillospiraceae bacterium]|nr:XRE family transcriptional regulator [Oscillospiraceae bacterium]
MAENPYRQARKQAAEKNPLLNNSESAQDIVHIERTRLIAIEKDQKTPYPEEVATMAEVYGAPELCDGYCTSQCPIGRGRKPLLYEDLNRISAQLMSSLYFLQSANDLVFSILEDGRVDPQEQEAFRKVLQLLDKVSYGAQSLKLWAQKNGYAD